MFFRKKQSEAEEFEMAVFLQNESAISMRQELKLWKKNIVEVIKDNLRKKNRTNKLYFTHDNFPPDEIKIYKKLQKEIAKLIPNECDRPTITLHIRHSKKSEIDKNDDACKADLGLLGGTGPLADAHFICKLIEELKKQISAWDNFYIILHSSPPPRKKGLTFGQAYRLFSHASEYVGQLRAFFSKKCHYYAMLSNTAHIHADKFTKLMDKSSQFIHLVNEITNRLVKRQAANVLILGTTDAADALLYPSLLKEANILSCQPSFSDQAILQFYIEQAKQGKAKEVAHDFFSFVLNEIKTHLPSQVLFSCTEISLLLEQEVEGHTCIEKLLGSLQGIELINSEEEIVNILVKKQSERLAEEYSFLQTCGKGTIN